VTVLLDCNIALPQPQSNTNTNSIECIASVTRQATANESSDPLDEAVSGSASVVGLGFNRWVRGGNYLGPAADSRRALLLNLSGASGSALWCGVNGVRGLEAP
jgi:hypothetical protein